MDYSLCPVYVVSILNFSIHHETEKSLENGLVSRYDIRNAQSGEQMTEALHFVYLELGRLKVNVDEPHKCKTLLEQFAYSTKYMHELPERPEGFDNPLLIDLYNATEFANWSPEKQQEYDSTMRTELDIIAEKEYVREEAHDEAHMEDAKRMLAKGYDIDEISEITSLSVDQINALK